MDWDDLDQYSSEEEDFQEFLRDSKKWREKQNKIKSEINLIDELENEKKRERPEDDYLYDESKDERDERWVDKNLRYIREKKEEKNENDDKTKNKKTQHKISRIKRENHNYVLNCPFCFTLLCVDCQRHEFYENQFRAMFVHNCSVDYGQVLKYKKQVDTNFKKEKKSKIEPIRFIPSSDSNSDNMEDKKISAPIEPKNSTEQTKDIYGNKIQESENNELFEYDVFYSVQCSYCQTEVGVIDEDEVYHFFHVLY